MARHYRKDDVEFHGTNHAYNVQPAVNVKVYGSMHNVKLPNPDICDDPRFTHEWIDQHIPETSEWPWNSAIEGGWEMLQDYATEIFGSGHKVYSTGRSGGWAYVTGLPEFDTWDALMLAKWAKFERFAKGVAVDIPYEMVQMIAWNAFEPWAAEQDEQQEARESWTA